MEKIYALYVYIYYNQAINIKAFSLEIVLVFTNLLSLDLGIRDSITTSTQRYTHKQHDNWVDDSVLGVCKQINSIEMDNAWKMKVCGFSVKFGEINKMIICLRSHECNVVNRYRGVITDLGNGLAYVRCQATTWALIQYKDVALPV